jgi:hypothetical protein
MRVLRLIALALVIASSSQFCASALTQDQKRAMDDYVIVAFAIHVGQGGRIDNITLVRCENPSDRKILTGALTPKEISMGVQMIAAEKFTFKRSEYGKTVYKALVFDKRVKKYIKQT